MGRKPRVEYKGAVYHVTHRGNNREFIFEDDEDKRYLLGNLAEIKDTMGLVLMGYVVMSNHYHLLAKTQMRPLSHIMQRLNNNYARYFNRKTGRSGHVFGDRYKCFLITDDKHLLTVLRYIHQNPVKAKIVNNSSAYKWSSDMHYRRNHDKFVDINFILDIISENRKKAIMHYIKFMGEEDALNINIDFRGSETLKALDDEKALPLVEAERKTLDEILWATGVSEEAFILIKNQSRKRDLTPYKLNYIKLAQLEGYTLKEIAENINSTTSAMGNLLSRWE